MIKYNNMPSGFAIIRESLDGEFKLHGTHGTQKQAEASCIGALNFLSSIPNNDVEDNKLFICEVN